MKKSLIWHASWGWNELRYLLVPPFQSTSYHPFGFMRVNPLFFILLLPLAAFLSSCGQASLYICLKSLWNGIEWGVMRCLKNLKRELWARNYEVLQCCSLAVKRALLSNNLLLGSEVKLVLLNRASFRMAEKIFLSGDERTFQKFDVSALTRGRRWISSARSGQRWKDIGCSKKGIG